MEGPRLLRKSTGGKHGKVRIPQVGGLGRAGAEQFLFGRVAPQALPLEQAILGALLLDRDAVPVVADILKDSSFYDERHQYIYAAIVRLYERSQPVDLLTVTEGLRREGRLETVGGPAYLAELTNKVASAANIEYHSRIVQQYAIQRQVIDANAQLVQKAYDDTTDALALLDEFQNQAIAIAQSVGGRESSHISSVARRRIEHVLDLPGKVGIRGISTGLTAVDEILSGLHPGDLGIVAARPGMGKTALVLGMATAVAQTGLPVDIYSLEMIEDQLVDRQAAQLAEVPASGIRKGNLSREEAEALAAAYEQLAELEIYIDDTAGIDLLQLRAKAKKAKLKHHTGLIIIDYIQQIEYSGKDAFNREQAVAIIAKQLKKLAKELEVPVIVLAQLSRAVEIRGGSKRPQLSDLRESGQIEQEADWVSFIYRPEYYQITEDEEGESLKGIAEFIVAKNRHGELGTARIRWEGAFTRFSDLEDPDLTADPPDGGAPLPPPPMIIRPSKFNEDEEIPY